MTKFETRIGGDHNEPRKYWAEVWANSSQGKWQIYRADNFSNHSQAKRAAKEAIERGLTAQRMLGSGSV